MRSTKNPGRFAGLLYLLTSIIGAFAIIYVPSKLIIHGNADQLIRWCCIDLLSWQR